MGDKADSGQSGGINISGTVDHIRGDMVALTTSEPAKGRISSAGKLSY